jgi:hypothetical protein
VHGALAGEPADVLQAPGEPVALALELLEAEQPRPTKDFAARHASGVGRDVREAGCDDLRELTLQSRYLSAQRATCSGLVEVLDSRRNAVDRQLLGVAHASDSS